MAITDLTTSFPWSRYSKKLQAKIETPRNGGIFTEEESQARMMRLAKGSSGTIEDSNRVVLYWLVDTDDGIIVDAKFQALGLSALIGAAEASCDLVVGKNYDQAKRITADLIDKHLRDKSENQAFPKESFPALNLVLEAMEEAASKCTDIPLSETYFAPPAPLEVGEVLEGGYPGFDEMPLNRKISLIEDVLNKDVRPYIELDAGGVEVMNLIHNREVIIKYQGSCTTCYSSTGATLSYIQKVLQAKVHPEIIVIPDLGQRI